MRCLVIGFCDSLLEYFFPSLYSLSFILSAPPILVPIEIRFHAYNSIGRSNNWNALNPLSLSLSLTLSFSLAFLSVQPLYLGVAARWRDVSITGVRFLSSPATQTARNNSIHSFFTNRIALRSYGWNHRKFMFRAISFFRGFSTPTAIDFLSVVVFISNDN